MREIWARLKCSALDVAKSLGLLRGWFIGPIGAGQDVNRFGVVSLTDGKPDSGVVVFAPDLSGYNGEIILRQDAGGPPDLCTTAGGSWDGASQVISGGGHDVTVDFVTIDVQASKTSFRANETITFTAGFVNFVPSNTTDVYWTWYPNSNGTGVVPVNACYGHTTCTYAPPGKGRMLVETFSPGLVPGFSTTISIINCPTGDPLLDNARFRDSLLVALAMSGQNTIPFSARREVGGYLYYDLPGTLQIKFSYKDSTPCANTLLHPGTEIAIFHTHPFNPREGSMSADILPSNCFGPSSLIYDAETFGGPSAVDWRGSVTSGKDMYIIDKKRIYKTDHTIVDSTKWKLSTKVWDWNTATCKW